MDSQTFNELLHTMQLLIEKQCENPLSPSMRLSAILRYLETWEYEDLKFITAYSLNKVVHKNFKPKNKSALSYSKLAVM